MAYRNKTFVSFASEHINSYYLMRAWKENEHIDFDFHDAHDLNIALDTSHPDTIRRRLRERLANTKQVVLLVGDGTRRIASDTSRFLYYEVETIKRLNLSVVFANLNKSRVSESQRLPQALVEPYTMSVAYGPKIIQYALDSFPGKFELNLKADTPKTGPHHYLASVYQSLGL
jgi:MTH538 TIR-like domain (DUF1863)